MNYFCCMRYKFLTLASFIGIDSFGKSPGKMEFAEVC